MEQAISIGTPEKVDRVFHTENFGHFQMFVFMIMCFVYSSFLFQKIYFVNLISPIIEPENDPEKSKRLKKSARVLQLLGSYNLSIPASLRCIDIRTACFFHLTREIFLVFPISSWFLLIFVNFDLVKVRQLLVWKVRSFFFFLRKVDDFPSE